MPDGNKLGAVATRQFDTPIAGPQRTGRGWIFFPGPTTPIAGNRVSMLGRFAQNLKAFFGRLLPSTSHRAAVPDNSSHQAAASEGLNAGFRDLRPSECEPPQQSRKSSDMAASMSSIFSDEHKEDVDIEQRMTRLKALLERELPGLDFDAELALMQQQLQLREAVRKDVSLMPMDDDGTLKAALRKRYGNDPDGAKHLREQIEDMTAELHREPD